MVEEDYLMCQKGETIWCMVPKNEDGDIWERKQVDKCLVPLVLELNLKGAYTKAVCCGHGEYPGSILLHDDTMIHLPLLKVN